MVRDLTIQKTQRKSKQTKEKAIYYFTENLINECSAMMKMDVALIRIKIYDYIQAIRECTSEEAVKVSKTMISRNFNE
jgi:hypothetical protein